MDEAFPLAKTEILLTKILNFGAGSHKYFLLTNILKIDVWNS
jgi:hypothetical protein